VCRTHLSRSVRIRDTISWLQEQLKLSRSSQTQEDSPKDQEELIRELVLSLHCKEQVLEDCLTLLLTQPGTSDPGRDPVVGNLREREEELKREKDEEAELVRQRDAEVQRLQLELREKDGDLARLQRVLCENQDTITAVRDLLGEKEFAVQQLEVALGSAVRSAASQDALRLSALREKDALIFAVQGALSSSNQDVEALADSLLSQGLDDLGGCLPPAGSPGPLLSQLQEKGRLLSQAHTESQRQSAQHQRDIHELLSALSDSQTLLQEQLRHCRERLQGGAPEVQRLRDALRLREAELRAERQRHACDMRETHTEMSQLYGSVRERDKHTQKLLQESQSRDEAIRRLQETLSPGGGMKATL
ncbi:uncharacterized protein LOC142486414, partial [Ascaphus truei]|uniref:uncharacterized protein LOC142486414 n=1 Tax=Ascaphus truei TaxID=8439 RepID=UPI003F5A4572